MLVLGIETSCDETSASVVENCTVVRSNAIASSRQVFSALGGVVPEEAARRQTECMMPIIGKAMADAGCTPTALTAIAVTRGPGLLGSLLVGTTAARVLSSVWGVPMIGVHHTLGHLSSAWLESDAPPVFPVLTLSVSGGHTDLWYRVSHLKGTMLGRTQDDAAGEAFDKGAVMLGLPYPGGPSIAKAAEGGDTSAFPFPLPLRNESSIAFSFSGLKTSLRYTLRDHPGVIGDSSKTRDLAASYQHAICRHLLSVLERAIVAHPSAREVHIVGGVSANTHLRALAEQLCERHGVRLRVPLKLQYCTDNAAMIAAAGSFMLEEDASLLGAPFQTAASLPLEETVIA